MRGLDLQTASSTSERAANAVKKLFLALGRNQLDKAAEQLTNPVQLFGRDVTHEVWTSSGLDATLGGPLANLLELEEGALDLQLVRDLIGVDVTDADRVFFATTQVNDNPVTYGVVVEELETSASVRALFDPLPFREWALGGQNA